MAAVGQVAVRQEIGGLGDELLERVDRPETRRAAAPVAEARRRRPVAEADVEESHQSRECGRRTLRAHGRTGGCARHGHRRAEGDRAAGVFAGGPIAGAGRAAVELRHQERVRGARLCGEVAAADEIEHRVDQVIGRAALGVAQLREEHVVARHGVGDVGVLRFAALHIGGAHVRADEPGLVEARAWSAGSDRRASRGPRPSREWWRPGRPESEQRIPYRPRPAPRRPARRSCSR